MQIFPIKICVCIDKIQKKAYNRLIRDGEEYAKKKNNGKTSKMEK